MGGLSDTFNAWQGLGAAAGGLLYASEITDRGQGYAGDMGTLAASLQDQSGFKGYGVKTGMGNSKFSKDGSLDVGVGPNRRMLLDANRGAHNGMTMMRNAGANMGNQQGSYMTGSQSALNNSIQNMSNNQGSYMAGSQSALNNSIQNMSNNQGAFMSGSQQAMGDSIRNMGSQQGAYMNASQQAMGNSMQDVAGREQDIYGRAMAMQQPMLDQQRAQMNAREYAQGRGGVRGSQFGGSGEDAAMARAQAQAQNNASFQAMGQAQQEMMNQSNMASQYGQMGQGMNSAMGQIGAQMGQMGQDMNSTIGQMGTQMGQLGQSMNSSIGQMGTQMGQLGQGLNNSMGQIGAQMGQMGQGMTNMAYTAPNYQLNALQAAAQGANMAQTGQLTGTGYGAQLGLGGIQTAVNADKAASEMYGNIVASMMNNANGENGSSSWLGSLLPF